MNDGHTSFQVETSFASLAGIVLLNREKKLKSNESEGNTRAEEHPQQQLVKHLQ
jgi:hypothetical protein